MRGGLSEAEWDRLGRLDPPWEPLTREQAETFETELRGEVSEGHALYGVVVRFLARRRRYDDFLAYAPDLESPWISVHLTWMYARQGKAESPPWPAAHLYASVDDFCAEQE